MSNADEHPDVILVVVHPDTQSVTWNVARAMKKSIAAENLTAATYDLAASGFDPAFNSDDLAHFRGLAGVPVDVAEQQQMLRSAAAVVLVFPVYWWSLPALAKGWIDRVFTRGFAYDDRVADAPSAIKGLHLVAIGGIDEGTHQRHGYKEAMTLQMIHGIADYSRIEASSLEFLYDADSDDPAVRRELIAQAEVIGATIAASVVGQREPASPQQLSSLGLST